MSEPAGNYFVVPRDAFLEAIAKVKACARTKTGLDHRFSLCGVSFWPVLDDDRLSVVDVVATDGSRMMVTHLKVEKSHGTWAERKLHQAILIDTACVGVLPKLFSDASTESVTVFVEANAVWITDVRHKLRSASHEGMYPDWKAISEPAKGMQKVDVPAGEFIHSVSLAAICANPEQKMVQINGGEGVVDLHNKAAEGKLVLGRSSSSFPIGVDASGVSVVISPEHVASMGGVFEDTDILELHLNQKHAVMFMDCKRLSLRCVLATSNPKAHTKKKA